MANHAVASLSSPLRIGEWIDDVATPAFVYDERILDELLLGPAQIRSAKRHLLFAMKPFPVADALRHMSPKLDGFAVSSLYEARLAREILSDGGSVHLTSPGLRPAEIDELGRLCDYIAFNSLSQWSRYSPQVSDSTSCGLRLNPGLSLVEDDRYDPCRLHSKLGIPIEAFVDAFAHDPSGFAALRGLHFHTNCDSTDFSGLLATVELIESELGHLLSELEWVNLGGGYLFEATETYGPLLQAMSLLESKYDLDVFLEPGASLVREAGFIISSVIDLFDSGGTTIAVLDTTVNHMPEVFEYSFEPDVIGHDDNWQSSYLLAGSTCLAGDIFGQYSFSEPLEIGSRVVFNNAGAYTLPKAHTFNGIDLPTIYAITETAGLTLKKQFNYEDWSSRWKADADAPV